MPKTVVQRKKRQPLAGLPLCKLPRAAERNRTADLTITNRLLYQLSYSGEEGKILLAPPDLNQRPIGYQLLAKHCDKLASKNRNRLQ
jgi:hypothetical protein